MIGSMCSSLNNTCSHVVFLLSEVRASPGPNYMKFFEISKCQVEFKIMNPYPKCPFSITYRFPFELSTDCAFNEKRGWVPNGKNNQGGRGGDTR